MKSEYFAYFIYVEGRIQLYKQTGGMKMNKKKEENSTHQAGMDTLEPIEISEKSQEELEYFSWITFWHTMYLEQKAKNLRWYEKTKDIAYIQNANYQPGAIQIGNLHAAQGVKEELSKQIVPAKVAKQHQQMVDAFDKIVELRSEMFELTQFGSIDPERFAELEVEVREVDQIAEQAFTEMDMLFPYQDYQD